MSETELTSKQPEVWVDRGNVLLLKGNYQEAVRAYDQGIAVERRLRGRKDEQNDRRCGIQRGTKGTCPAEKPQPLKEVYSRNSRSG